MQSWTDLAAWSLRGKKQLQRRQFCYTVSQAMARKIPIISPACKIVQAKAREHFRGPASKHLKGGTTSIKAADRCICTQCWFQITTSHNCKPYPSTSTKCQRRVLLLTLKTTITDIGNTTNIGHAVACAVVHGRQRPSLQQHSLVSYTFHWQAVRNTATVTCHQQNQKSISNKL